MNKEEKEPRKKSAVNAYRQRDTILTLTNIPPKSTKPETINIHKRFIRLKKKWMDKTWGKRTFKNAIEFILCKLSPAGHGDWF